MARLIVVSNRVVDPREEHAGGLAAALQSALRERGGIWFGWNGEVVPNHNGKVYYRRVNRITYATIGLTRTEYNDYYKGFANRTLWPLLHYRNDLCDYQRSHYEGYIRVNDLFATCLTELIRPDDTLWVHDYHLIPLAARLRAHGVGNPIGFFLHTPLAPGELLATLPNHRKLFSTLGAYDLVGVQTQRDLQALRGYFSTIANATLEADDVIRLPDGQHFRAGHFPISIDVDGAQRMARTAMNSTPVRRLRRRLSDYKLMVGVDRLDYSKGLPQRFDAFAAMLQDDTWRHRVCLLQIAPPSRSDIPEYRDIRRVLERRTGHINGALAEPDWVPIHYVNQTVPHAALAGYYRSADVGLVTPLRDGMNLVAKEYVASQDPEDPGVLVLSRFAGAAEELGDAVLVNPHDQDGTAEALARALDMPLDERKARWQAMMDVLRGHDIATWRREFLDALAVS